MNAVSDRGRQTGPEPGGLVFFTLVSDAGEVDRARLLIESIRSFGGELAGAPAWVFDTCPEADAASALALPGVRVVPLVVPRPPLGRWLADKVAACARAESLAGTEVTSLVWLDAAGLVVKPPVLLRLTEADDVALRPVHIRNVGLPADGPVDDYWQRIYQAAGMTDAKAVVESFVDVQRLRAYYNTHAVAVNPARGLFRRWQQVFRTLLDDDSFRRGACRDDRHRIFLHQAVFSALVTASIEPARIRLLPPDYSYPYNLHEQVPPERRARALNDLTHAVGEGRPFDPDRMTDIAVWEPLRAWLAARRSRSAD